MAQITHFLDETYKTVGNYLTSNGKSICIITGEVNPKKGGFYVKEGGFCISSNAIKEFSNRGFNELGIVIGDALLDSDITKNEHESIIKLVLDNIEKGIISTIKHHKELHKKNII